MKKNNIYKGIGIMSGTSLDGLDIAYSEYYLKNNEWSFSSGPAKTITYPDEIKKKLERSMEFNGEELAAFDSSYGLWIGEQVNQFIRKQGLSPDFIASHGHTVFHQPENKYTLQIGDGNGIHAVTGIPVIFNFRKLDVALGGQGAPLVPVGDAFLFSTYDYCLNLGGIANISRVDGKDAVAYDIGAANMVLNFLARRNGEDYDTDGNTAVKGKMIEPLLRELDQLDFYIKKGPKSLGYEHVSQQVLPLLSEDYVVDDLLHTYTHHIAKKISESLRELDGKEGHNMLVTGGGARNKYLIKLLRDYCKPVKVDLPKVEIIDYKEAIVFGFLGLLRILGETNVWAHVTGASRDSCSGIIAGDFKK
jgi:anhydro-N-acetylmuramic acid kinase